jgi:ABC-type oligopeptide transport system ATPase subunit
MCLIKVNNLTKEFRYSTGIFLPVINDISFSIAKNETMGLLGKIGSGKSTVGLCLLRLLKPTSGEIYYNNVRVDNISQKAFTQYRKKYQIIFQDSSASLNPVYTIEEQLKEVVLYYKITSKTSVDNYVDNSLVEVGLEPELKLKYPHEISTGEKQRVCIARALLTNPEFIVLDEITSSLDVINEKKIIDLLKDLQKRKNLSYLFITHDVDLALDFCNKIMLIEKGQVLFFDEKAKAGEVLRNHFKN